MGTAIFDWLGILVVTSPALLLLVLGLAALLGWSLSERIIVRCTQTAVAIGLLSSIGILFLMLALDDRHVTLELGQWVLIPQQHFHFTLKFVFDRLSVPFVILSFLLCGTIGAFARSYLHREIGYQRFFIFYALFLLGMVMSSVAGTIETLFMGWELVGLSSALLVAFFHDRRSPVRNGLRVWAIYRFADAAFLIAALTMHHMTHGGDFEVMMGEGPWPEGRAVAMSSGQATFVGLLLLVAAAGKSALVPFSGWLPRAMEGPTPSSAVFYGALSVHLGAFLLLRVSPILEQSLWLRMAVVALGVTTAVLASAMSRVQSDIKSALSFASLTQVSIIVAEIGLGFRYIALIHMLGHACLRTLQLLRAPSLLQDYHHLENAIGSHLPGGTSGLASWIGSDSYRRLYRFWLQRAYLDTLLDRWCVQPFVQVFTACDRWERAWTRFLSGPATPASTQPEKEQPEAVQPEAPVPASVSRTPPREVDRVPS